MLNMILDERVTLVIDKAVPITQPSINVWRWVYQKNLGPLLPGDRLVVQCEHEFTNDAGYLAECCTAVSLTNSAPWYNEDLYGLHPTPTAGLWVCEPEVVDVDPRTRHHEAVTRAGEIVVPVGFDEEAWLTFRSRSHSSVALGGQALTIEPTGYGHMSYQIYRADGLPVS